MLRNTSAIYQGHLKVRYIGIVENEMETTMKYLICIYIYHLRPMIPVMREWPIIRSI